jgi:hypothetical protein
VKLLRHVASIAVLVLLGGGYIASQVYAFNGEATQWARTVDNPSMVWLSLVVLAGAIGLSFVKEKP